MDNLPFSQACENNKGYILEVLQRFFESSTQVLEVASGTGQHACFFAEHLPWLQWQPTEVAANLPVLSPRCTAYPQGNLLAPQVLDVTDDPWPVAAPDAMFTANSLHIMGFAAVEAFFSALARIAPPNMKLAVYGPFNYGGDYTSESNKRFDAWLVQQNPESGIRDFEAVDALATNAGFRLFDDVEMPANNRLLLWQRSESPS